FAANPAGLVAAEGSAGLDHVQVDPVSAGPDLAGDLHAPLSVSGPHRSGEAVLAVIGDADCLLFILVGDHAEYRPEDLLTRDAHVGGHVCEPGRRDVPAAVTS